MVKQFDKLEFKRWKDYNYVIQNRWRGVLMGISNELNSLEIIELCQEIK